MNASIISLATEWYKNPLSELVQQALQTIQLDKEI